MSSNKNSITDGDGENSDWIELYNSGDSDVDLTGMHLSDDDKRLNKWRFPYTIIPAKSFLIIWASGKDKVDTEGSLHTNFSISVDGEEVILTDLYGEKLDSIEVPALSADISFGRMPDGGDNLKTTTTPTPGSGNILSEILTTPVFSRAAGFYQQEFLLNITHPDPNTIILYTLDGSEPVMEHLEGESYQYKNRYKELPIHQNGGFTTDEIKTFVYTQGINIKNRAGDPMDVSKIPSTYQNSADYIPSNTQDVFKGTVVKARAYTEGVGYSPVVSRTYFIHPEGRAKYLLPVISLSASKEFLFDYNKGIHVAGIDFDEWRRANQLTPANPYVPANYQRRGEEWEYPAHLEYYETAENNAAISQSVGIRIHGGWTRSEPQKAFRIYARKDYGNSVLEYPFFTQTEEKEFKRIIIKNTFNYRVVDGVSQDLVSHLNFPTQASQYAVVFLNGEYWGLQEIKERFDKHYLAGKYGIDPDNIDYLNNEGLVDEGDNIAYTELLNYVQNSSMTGAEDYNYIEKKMDIENYIDYYAAEIYSGNRDWPHNNIDYWRVRTDSVLQDVPYGHDGRWRWMMYDLDLAMDGVATSDSFTHNTLEWASREHTSTVLFRSIIKNSIFSTRLVNRFADLLNTTFLYERIYPVIEQQKRDIVRFFPEHLKRWTSINGGVSRLNLTLNRMSNFAKNRSSYVRRHLQDKFQLEGQVLVTLDINYHNTGNFVRINTIDIHKNTVGVSEQPYPWNGIYFNGIPVEITAVAAPGYAFSHWEGMPENTPVSFSQNFTQNISLKAVFNKLFTTEYTLTYRSSEGGYIEGDSIQMVEESMNGTPVSANPYEGYIFHSWSDGSVENPRTDKNIFSDITVDAIFELVTGAIEKQNLPAKVHPNPAMNTLTITLNEEGYFGYRILNIQGQQIQSGSFYENIQVINVSHLPASVYILWIEGKNNQITYYKFIKK